jgi:UDP-N-acetyl-D-galactosamine dehydrogenase
VDVVKNLADFGCQVDIFDPWAAPEEISKEYGLDSIQDLSGIADKKYDVIILAVSHRQFADLDIGKFKNPQSIVFDIKSALPKGVADARL